MSCVVDLDYAAALQPAASRIARETSARYMHDEHPSRHRLIYSAAHDPSDAGNLEEDPKNPVKRCDHAPRTQLQSHSGECADENNASQPARQGTRAVARQPRMPAPSAPTPTEAASTTPPPFKPRPNNTRGHLNGARLDAQSEIRRRPNASSGETVSACRPTPAPVEASLPWQRGCSVEQPTAAHLPSRPLTPFFPRTLFRACLCIPPALVLLCCPLFATKFSNRPGRFGLATALQTCVLIRMRLHAHAGRAQRSVKYSRFCPFSRHISGACLLDGPFSLLARPPLCFGGRCHLPRPHSPSHAHIRTHPLPDTCVLVCFHALQSLLFARDTTGALISTFRVSLRKQGIRHTRSLQQLHKYRVRGASKYTGRTIAGLHRRKSASPSLKHLSGLSLILVLTHRSEDSRDIQVEL